jgi:3-carboxy-cis,cis-muconate cycloisomerase
VRAGEAGVLTTLFADEELAAIFSEPRYLAEMVAVEAALATAEARLGVIPAESGKAIAGKAASFRPDPDLIRSRLAGDGVPVIELVRQLREHVGGPAGDDVHFGATTQDIMDTALVLQIRAALAVVEQTLEGVIDHLAGMARRYRDAVMPGRTHSQQAVPIPFGLKAAGWLAPLLRHRARLAELRPRVLAVQLGGAAGTLEPLGARGVEVVEALAAELGLSAPSLPWHTQRDTLAELAGWLSLVSGSLAKMAQDVILLAQTEVGEVRETAEEGRGGSSTMPQKVNPVTSEQIIAAARTNAALLGAMHQALVQEHERATSGWQIEWLTLPRMFELTASALRKAEFLAAHLDVDEARMRHNVSASNGLMLAETLTFALSRTMSRKTAKALVTAACRTARTERRHLVDVVRGQTDAPLDWDALKSHSIPFGSAQAFIDRVLAAARSRA